MSSFSGIIPYLPSPLTSAGRVDEPALRSLIDHLIDSGVHGLSPLGSTGEIMYLDRDAREEVIRITVEQSGGRVPVIPGIAAFSSADGVHQAERAFELGADGLVAIQQVYFSVPTSGTVSYFGAIADATPLPVVLYTNPRLGTDLPADAVVELAVKPTVRYMKDASGVTGRILSLQERVGDRILHFAASAHVPALVFELGGAGWMGGPACLAPRAATLLWETHRAGRRDAMWSLQRALWPLNAMFQKYSLATFVKFGLACQGHPVGPPVAPQKPLEASVGAEFAAVMRRIDGVVDAVQSGAW